MFAVFLILDMQGYFIKKGWLFAMVPLVVNILLMGILVYGNTLVLIPMVLQKKRVALYIAGIVGLAVLQTLLRSKCQQYWDGLVWADEPMTLQSYFKWNLFYATWFILISSMLFFTQKWSEQRQQVKNIQINQLQTELKYLRAQINPHFLFNGLNTIYGNIDIRNQRARDILLQFSDLLRYNLYEADVDWVELEKEIAYLENYVALQRARSNTNLQVELEVSIEDKSLPVAPLIFIAFVENAFKYSTRDDNRVNSIRIRLRQQGNRIVFQCSNSYEQEEPTTGGIGISNVTRRLELLYKGRYELNIQKDPTTYSIQLTLTV